MELKAHHNEAERVAETFSLDSDREHADEAALAKPLIYPTCAQSIRPSVHPARRPEADAANETIKVDTESSSGQLDIVRRKLADGTFAVITYRVWFFASRVNPEGRITYRELISIEPEQSPLTSDHTPVVAPGE